MIAKLAGYVTMGLELAAWVTIALLFTAFDLLEEWHERRSRR